MSLREKHKLSAISDEVNRFEQFIARQDFTAALDFWRKNLDSPTLYGIETSLRRAALLRLIEVEKLLSVEDQIFVLQSLAQSLILTGGYLGEAIPLYEKHREICERIGATESLSATTGDYCDALRQNGRLFEAEKVACDSLKLIRQRRDFFREAIVLNRLGAILFGRGERKKAETAWQRSFRILHTKFETAAEDILPAFLAQRALQLGFYDEALSCATSAEKVGKARANNDFYDDAASAVRIYTAALRIKGEALIFLQNPERGTDFLLKSLQKSREIEFVGEELAALCALATVERERENYEAARDYLKKCSDLAQRGNFTLFIADSFNILAQIELDQGDEGRAAETAKRAFRLAVGDGKPFIYHQGIASARRIFDKLQLSPPEIPDFSREKFSFPENFEINPPGDFF